MMFEFGKCKTDHKPGKVLSRPIDYMNDRPYAEAVEKALAALGIPMPEPENIFRGNKHDMLFLNSHGVVVRIGHTEVKDMINPAILQPLGWLEDRNLGKQGLPFCIAVYPGIELFTHYESQSNRPPATPGQIKSVLSMTGQSLADLHEENKGIIRVVDDAGKTYAVPLLIDIDNDLNGIQYKTEETSGRKMRAHFNSPNPGDVISKYMSEVFLNAHDLLPHNSGVDIAHYQKAFAAHAPLRAAFWETFKTCDLNAAAPDPAKRFGFWQSCKKALNAEVDLSYPVWSAKRDERGRITFERTEIPATVSVSLYRPWTAKRVDIPHAAKPEALRL